MAMLAFVLALLLVAGIGLVIASARRAALPGEHMDLDVPADPPNRPSGDQG